MKKKTLLTDILKHLFLLILALIVLTPIYYLIVTTFKSGTEAALHPMSLPSSFDFGRYVQAFHDMQYPRAFKNTLLITVGAVVGIIGASSMCGYVLNRKGKKKITQFIFLLILSGMMFPYQMSIMGLYKLIRGLGLMNSLLGVILIDIAINIPFATFLMKNFISTVPIELEEAAKIDGAGVFRTFATITFPLLKPVVATIAILNTLNVWNDFMGPLYFLQTRENDVILQEVYRNIGQFSTDWTSLFPMMVLGVLPLLIFYLFMQRYIISGVMAGSVKG
ncbi:carbohydrate ABC transporter permease [Faecalicatena orotica]|uniref:Carbohydrate ABC transporter membrane protein 2 (CUT1 family) n=1 Tax=Faecalicatena orotica TaxID=1544 RepID=A0A2Y9BC46_9FIRM|nr:carbohydrate ABC transporter permease [Faecalicatena orotica]PWJ32474.1 carbohydrate ABC transporter membrane protein 2 (CUT1 family) [Faecalicatena orotica]SSA54309.1 carbohydrate ABC transporter membrane protein 2, CUT1 family [Faecalicatena orotica]